MKGKKQNKKKKKIEEKRNIKIIRKLYKEIGKIENRLIIIQEKEKKKKQKSLHRERMKEKIEKEMQLQNGKMEILSLCWGKQTNEKCFQFLFLFSCCGVVFFLCAKP